MRRAMQVLKGMGPQESVRTYPHPYDHPYFGQLFLAAALGAVGYPPPAHILNPSSSFSHSNTTLDSSCCYTDPINIDPGHTSTFDSFDMASDISGRPVSYRLSFEGKLI